MLHRTLTVLVFSLSFGPMALAQVPSPPAPNSPTVSYPASATPKQRLYKLGLDGRNGKGIEVTDGAEIAKLTQNASDSTAASTASQPVPSAPSALSQRTPPRGGEEPAQGNAPAKKEKKQLRSDKEIRSDASVRREQRQATTQTKTEQNPVSATNVPAAAVPAGAVPVVR